MRKSIIFLLTAALALTLVSCGGVDVSVGDEGTEDGNRTTVGDLTGLPVGGAQEDGEKDDTAPDADDGAGQIGGTAADDGTGTAQDADETPEVPPEDNGGTEDDGAGNGAPEDDGSDSDAPKDETPKDDPPKDDPPKDDAPENDPPKDETPENDPPKDNPPKNDPPAAPSVDTPPAIEAPAVEPPVDEPPVEEPPADVPPVEEPPAGTSPALSPEEAKAIAMGLIDSDVSALYSAVGRPVSSDYAPSCLGSGEDGNLYYDGFTVYTYREGNSEVISYVE